MTTTYAPEVTATPIGNGTGLLLTPTDRGQSIDVLQHAGLDKLLANAGHLLLRGFNGSPDQFNDLVQAYSSRITIDPARVFHGSVAQKVDSGTGAIGFHIENGATPFIPDLLWFYCITAASTGSQTTVCDGFRVWDELSAESREAFSAKPIKYTRTVPRELWQKFAQCLANNGRDASTMTLSDLYNLTSDYGKCTFEEGPDGSLTYDFVVYAARAARGTERISWANSIFGPSHNYQAPEIRYVDGSEIPVHALDEAAKITDELTEEIAWQDGDIVLIDNSRVMHGRRPILDTNRTILNAQSYAR